MRREGWVALALLGLGAGTGWALARGRPVPADPGAEPAAPVVRVAEAGLAPHRVVVHAHGTVEARTASDLVAEVSGRVIRVSPALAAGGFFERGDTLLEIDRSDYQSAERRARAALERARSELELQAAELARTLTLAERRVASDSILDQRRHAERQARAAVEEASAALDQARRDLARTRLTAPFAGRVRSKNVDVGEFVSRGAPLAQLYAVDFAEIRLPIRDEDLAFLDLSLGDPGRGETRPMPEVTVRGRFAGGEHAWPGRVVRTEGEIDVHTRMLHVVARVEDPYGLRNGRTPLALGMFVEAEIAGRVLPDVLELPRSALRADESILVVDTEDRIRMRPVEVLRRIGERVIARAALAAGERLCLSPLAAATDGMRVQPIGGGRDTGHVPPTELARRAP